MFVCMCMCVCVCVCACYSDLGRADFRDRLGVVWTGDDFVAQFRALQSLSTGPVCELRTISKFLSLIVVWNTNTGP